MAASTHTADSYDLIEGRYEGLRHRFRETWKARRLIPFFGRMFVRRRYARTFLGPIWLFLRPAMMVLSQLFVFAGVFGVEPEGTPYLIFFMVTFSTWTLFEESAYFSTRCLELVRSMLRRLYIPRGVILIASGAVALNNYVIVTGMLIITLIAYVFAEGVFYLDVSPQMLLLAPAFFAALACGLTVGSLLAVAGAQFRDVRFGLRYALRFWYFFTPVAYPASEVPSNLRVITEINPLTAPVGTAKYALLSEAPPTLASVISCLAFLAIFGTIGATIFFRGESAALDHL